MTMSGMDSIRFIPLAAGSFPNLTSVSMVYRQNKADLIHFTLTLLAPNCVDHGTIFFSRYTDCVVLTHNDDVLARLQRSKESVSFTNINDSISGALCGVFHPTNTLRPKRFVITEFNNINDRISGALCGVFHQTNTLRPKRFVILQNSITSMTASLGPCVGYSTQQILLGQKGLSYYRIE